MSVIGPTNLDPSDLDPNAGRSAPAVSSTIQGDSTDVDFFLRVVAPAYNHSYPPDVYAPPVAPVLTTLAPNSIVAGTPTPVTVTGTDFTHNSQVYVDGVAQITQFVSPTEVRYLGEATAAGTQDVTVQTKGLESNALVLTVTASVQAEAEPTDAVTADQTTEPPPDNVEEQPPLAAGDPDSPRPARRRKTT